MTIASGSIKYDGTRLVGAFDIEGSPRYITVDVRPANQPFECNKATLAYSNITQLDGACKWTGTAGKDGLEMNFSGGVSISGQLVTARSSISIRGAGTWSTDKATLPTVSTNPDNEPQGSGSNDLTAVDQLPLLGPARDPAKLLREKQLIESGVPIVAYATVCASSPCSSLTPS